MMPLLGLGCDQVSTSKRLEKRFNAYHVDEFRDKDYAKLIRRLETYHPSDKTSILILISPQELKPSSRRYKLFITLAEMGHISVFFFDEAPCPWWLALEKSRAEAPSTAFQMPSWMNELCCINAMK